MPPIQASENALTRLSEMLSEVFGQSVKVDSIEEVTEGGNRANHRKAILADGRTVGIKAAERVTKGAEREYLTALTARKLKIPGSGACGIFYMPDGLPLAGKQVAALEWLSGGEPIQKLPNLSEARQSSETAKQLGEWFWLCLYFGVSDRHMGNWVWSENKKAVAMIDCEDWQPNSQTPQRLNPIAKEILGPSFANHASQMFHSMMGAKQKLAAVKVELNTEFGAHGESVDSPYENIDVKDLITKICGVSVAKLPG